MTVTTSVYAKYKKLHSLVANGVIGKEVLAELIPDGKPLLTEKVLWDYKLELASPPEGVRPSNEDKDSCKQKMAEIVKDVVAFYNTSGGYIVAGVRDNPRELIGYNRPFNCDELNKKVLESTGCEIDCDYKLVEITVDNTSCKVGLLFIPKRGLNLLPAQFRRDAPKTLKGKQAYSKGDIYHRVGDSCKPAESSKELEFLFSKERRRSVENQICLSSDINNNLGSRDPGFIEFIGREEYISDLWKWLCDKYSHCKLLSGMGGVGKTTIAREFSESIISSAPVGIENIIWLSAKKRFYTSILNKYEETSRVDFFDTDSLLVAMLKELGHPEGKIDSEWSHEELVEQVVESLNIFPSFIVVDDVDSLNPDQQNDVFQTLVQIATASSARSKHPSKFLLTARLELGAAPSQLVKVKGLDLDEFKEFVLMTAGNIGVEWTRKHDAHIKKFHSVTDGSPTFANSILRIISLGDPIAKVLHDWQGADGQEVRKFAFEKELDQLSDSQHRALYALCILGETSSVELQHILQCNSTLLRDDLGGLRNYHLLALGGDTPTGGSSLLVPSGIRLMKDIIRERVSDFRRIERECAKARKGLVNINNEIGNIIHRTVALWQDSNTSDALEFVKFHDGKSKNMPDIKCLLGRAYLKLDPPDARHADSAFRKAYELKCNRPELLDLWINTKLLLNDWIGLLEVTDLFHGKKTRANRIYHRARAYLELGKNAESTSNLPGAAGYYLQGGRCIQDAFDSNDARGKVQDLIEIKTQMLEKYVILTDTMTSSANDHIDVWIAVENAYNLHMKSPYILRLGVSRLTSWWEAVENRGAFDEKAATVMRVQLNKVYDIIQDVKNHENWSAEKLIHDLEYSLKTLDDRCENYQI